MAGRRFAFWGGVALVSVLSHHLLELAAEKFPSSGLRQFVAYTHRGVS